MLKTCDALNVSDDESSCTLSSVPHATHRLPIIAMMANARPEDRTRCLEASMDDDISKPVQSKVLAEVLVRWVLPAQPVSAGMSEAGSRVKAKI
jgi:CheY-like chemotaxis protein